MRQRRIGARGSARAPEDDGSEGECARAPGEDRPEEERARAPEEDGPERRFVARTLARRRRSVVAVRQMLRGAPRTPLAPARASFRRRRKSLADARRRAGLADGLGECWNDARAAEEDGREGEHARSRAAAEGDGTEEVHVRARMRRTGPRRAHRPEEERAREPEEDGEGATLLSQKRRGTAAVS